MKLFLFAFIQDEENKNQAKVRYFCNQNISLDRGLFTTVPENKNLLAEAPLIAGIRRTVS